MTDPANPVRTAVLSTPAMQTPQESLVLSQSRGLIMAVSGDPITEPGVVDVRRVAGLPRPGAEVEHAARHARVGERPPGIVACSPILSGLRVFDIRDPYRPKEIAYYDQPVPVSATSRESGAYAMSAPAFVPEGDETGAPTATPASTSSG